MRAGNLDTVVVVPLERERPSARPSNSSLGKRHTCEEPAELSLKQLVMGCEVPSQVVDDFESSSPLRRTAVVVALTHSETGRPLNLVSFSYALCLECVRHLFARRHRIRSTRLTSCKP
jgi:hypothetical protein